MHRLEMMKDQLISAVQGQLNCLDKADPKELGEAIDMIKDLDEAIYYCSVVKAMDEKEKNGEYIHTTYPAQSQYMKPEHYRDMDKIYGKMYYTEPRMYDNPRYDQRIMYDEGYRPSQESNYRDSREGKSYIGRRNYMEAKELHQENQKTMKELEHYLKDLSEDIVEMLEHATVEEKQMVKTKMSNILTSIK